MAGEPNERPTVTVDLVVLSVADQASDDYRRLPGKALQILLVQRGDGWALPGAPIGAHESLDEAAARVLSAQTAIGEVYMEQLYTWGDIHQEQDPRIISCSYLALVEASHRQAAPPPAGARWFSLQEQVVQAIRTITPEGYLLEQLHQLDLHASTQHPVEGLVRVAKRVTGKATEIERRVESGQGLAQEHLRIIQYGLERLRTKTAWSDIAFNLMPDLFTMAELRQVYEVILGRELHAANFRRDSARMVEETNQVRSGVGHRRPKLFRFNPRWSENV